MQAITSREYKMMLQAKKFAGDEAKLSEAAGALWRDLAGIILPSAITVSGTDDVAMQSKEPGYGQIYLASYRDADGDWLDGGTNYVLKVPADVPAAEFWSLTAYDVSTRAPLRNEQQVADKSSRMDLDVNDDGSVTLYIGPDEPPAGTKNWIPTVPGNAWFPYFRFYSPTDAYFDRSWVLPDIEKRG